MIIKVVGIFSLFFYPPSLPRFFSPSPVNGVSDPVVCKVENYRVMRREKVKQAKENISSGAVSKQIFIRVGGVLPTEQ